MALNQVRRWLRGFIATENSGLKRKQARSARPEVEVLECRLAPAAGVYTVTSAGDNGTFQNGTLSWAIQQAIAWDQPNNPANPKQLPGTINFNVAGGVITVTGATGEPVISKPMTINGYTQGGNNTVPGTPYLELKGGAGNNLAGLGTSSGGVVIEGMAIDSFGADGIDLNDPGVGAGKGDTIQGCYIGTDLSGTKAGVGNNFGISIEGSNNTVGGASSSNRNLISGNTFDGIALGGPGSLQNVIQNNTIGLDKTGLNKLPNARFGVSFNNGANSNTIGGSNLNGAVGNVISGNGSNGINIINSSNQNSICGNTIGLGIDGTTVLGNASDGIVLC